MNTAHRPAHTTALFDLLKRTTARRRHVTVRAVATTIALAAACSTASAGIVGVAGDTTLEGGWGLFEASVPYGPMEVIINGHEFGPPYELTYSWSTTLGDVLLDPVHEARHTTLGDEGGWATWSHDYEGEVFLSPATTATYTMPAGVGGFDAYLSPNPFDVFTFTITGYASDGSSAEIIKDIESIPIEGDGGASHFGFYTTGGATLTAVNVSAEVTFAIGEMRIVAIPASPAFALLALTALARPTRRRIP